MIIVGAIFFVISMVIVAAAQTAHKRETGVAAPTRKTMAYLRRQARKKGITENQAYGDWLLRKQRGLAAPAVPTSYPRYTITPAGVVDGEARFSFHCGDCGGYEIHVDDEPKLPTSPVSCTACAQPLGTLADIERVAHTVGVNAGLKFSSGTTWRDRNDKVV